MRSIALAGFVILSLAAPARAADSIRCNGSIVSIGASKVDLLGKCGEPTRSEAHDEQRSTFVADPSTQTASEKRVTVTVERWTYDLGPGDFIRTVSIENGKIIAIAEGGYGSSAGKAQASAVAVSRCDPLHDFSLGDTTDKVLFRCGEPASREYKRVDRLDTAQDATGIVSGTSTTAQLEIWSYNFGANSFTRQLHFRDGKLVKIATGGYGFGG